MSPVVSQLKNLNKFMNKLRTQSEEGYKVVKKCTVQAQHKSKREKCAIKFALRQ